MAVPSEARKVIHVVTEFDIVFAQHEIRVAALELFHIGKRSAARSVEIMNL